MKILNFLALSHYTVGGMILFTIAALIVGIVSYNRHRNLRIFTYYCAFSLVADIGAYYVDPNSDATSYEEFFGRSIQLLFALFEIIICNIFILRCVSSRLRRRVIRINLWIYLAYCIFITAATYHHIHATYYVAPECVSLVIPCLIYFYELFLIMNLRPLKDQPAFWVITGILFLNACDIPLIVATAFLGTYEDEAFSVNCILYSILFALLIKAYLCPPENGRAKSNPLKSSQT